MCFHVWSLHRNYVEASSEVFHVCRTRSIFELTSCKRDISQDLDFLTIAIRMSKVEFSIGLLRMSIGQQ